MKNNARLLLSRKPKGQVAVLFAFVALGLIAVIGLTIDLGVVFLNYTNLRRAVDAASLAGASKYRLNVSHAEMETIATEFLKLNGVNDPSVVITTCNQTPVDTTLCPTGLNRKLVRVQASSPVDLNFINIVPGIPDTLTVYSEATSEAASLDVILVLDTSESMTWDAEMGNADGGDDERDPMVCNNLDSSGTDGYPGECHPFEEVKMAAVDFLDELYFPFDRVGVVTFDRWDNYPTRLDLTNNKATVVNYIKNLQVTPWMQLCADYSGNNDRFHDGPCASYDWGFYVYDCEARTESADAGVDPPDPRTCGATNTGAGMESANEMFAAGRESALWVVILLTDGATNASVSRFVGGSFVSGDPEYFGWCPVSTWDTPACRNGRSDPVTNRHYYYPPSPDPDYDSADFAYDMIDLVADRTDDWPDGDAQKLIYSIGLGDAVTENSLCWDGSAEINDCDPDAGEIMLKYAARQGDGEYYFAPSPNQLRRIFQSIAEKIAFRITQ